MTIQNNPINESIRSCIQELIPYMAQDIHEEIIDRLKMYAKAAGQYVKSEVISRSNKVLTDMATVDAQNERSLVHAPLAAKLGLSMKSFSNAIKDPTHQHHQMVTNAIAKDPEAQSKLKVLATGSSTRGLIGKLIGVSAIDSTINNPTEQQALVDTNHARISDQGARSLRNMNRTVYDAALRDPTHRRHNSVVAAHAIAQMSHPTEHEIRSANPVNPTLYRRDLVASARKDRIKQRSDITQRVSTAHRFQPASRGIIGPAIDRFLQRNPRALGIYRTAATII